MNPLPTRPTIVRAARYFEVIDDFPAGNVAVNGLTILLPWTNLGATYDQMVAKIGNPASNLIDCQLIVDVSHGGVLPDIEKEQTSTAHAGEECSCTVTEPNPHTWIKISAVSATAISINWALLGIRRY